MRKFQKRSKQKREREILKTGNFWDSIKIKFRRKSSGIRLKSNLEVSPDSKRLGEQKKIIAK